MGHRLRSTLLSTNKQLTPKMVNPSFAKKKMKELQVKSKAHYDKNEQKLPPPKIGESVHVQKESSWEPAKIISQHNEHSYNVQSPAGAVYCRNRKFLNKTPKHLCPNFHSSNYQHPSKKKAKRVITDTSAKIPESNVNFKSSQEPQKTPDNVVIKSPVKIQDSETHNQSTPMKTRSGQLNQPNKLYSGEEWVK